MVRKKSWDQVSFQLDSGEFMAVLGVNGVGKSTLITCMNRIHKPQNGVVLMNGQNVLSLSNHEAAKRMAYVSQFSEISRLTVFDTVLLGRKPYMKWSVSADDMELCNQILERLGIGDWKLRYMDELSGGEKQKVMLARAMAQEPELLLLDEPTSCLDPKNRHDVLELVKAYIDEKRVSGLMVIHDVNLALRYCKPVLVYEAWRGTWMRRSGNSDLQDDPTGLRNAGICGNDQRKKNCYVWIKEQP